jgi:hypothetical protein
MVGMSKKEKPMNLFFAIVILHATLTLLPWQSTINRVKRTVKQ